MPRRQFVADLDKAQTGVLPRGIAGLKAGEDDGQFEFLFTGPDGLLPGVRITALITDVSDYPKSHEYMIFGDDDAPRNISNALQDVRGTDRKTVYELLDIVAATLSKVSTDRDGDSQMPDSQYDDEYNDESEDDADIYDSDHEAFHDTLPTHTPAYATQAPSATKARTSTDRSFRQRIRSDLGEAKNAGFKVGVLGHMLEGYNAYATISIRVAKLGISEEAMQAWQIEPSDYLILIIQYPNGYKSNEELQGYDSLRLAPNIGMRLVAGRHYKPTLQEAIKAFTTVRRDDRGSIGTADLPGPEAKDAEESSIRDTFISQPLKALLQERLVPILRYRSAGMGWMGAEDWYRQQASAGLGASTGDIVPDRHFAPEEVSDAIPAIVKGDHYATRGQTQFSFPLLAMQFTLRHFVRCTEFCLVCHRKLTTDAEAIKPYVCDNGLCLYQYMSLGFGPSIEHEVIAQPYVVDLLISFCYSSAAARRLKDFPEGLSLMVPPVDTAVYNVLDPAGYGRYAARPKANPKQEEVKQATKKLPNFEVGFDRSRKEIIFYDASKGCPVRRGDWIVLNTDSVEGCDLHCRIMDTTFFPTISTEDPVTVRQQLGTTELAPQTPATTRPVSPAHTSPNWEPATFQKYEQDFDGLNNEGKCLAICRLLDTLPTVTQMRDYLSNQQTAELRTWTQCMSPSALSLLRWIIASNRACIMQVDGDIKAEGDKAASKTAPTVFGKNQERCYGMKDYMQFRFAMGAPDKEQRFISEVRKTTERLKLQYPTLFAWHGSPLFNWHMIIREGLHYKNADHGRAYGDGVYHAKEAQTSTGYSGGMGVYPNGQGVRMGGWPSSVLRISSAIALNEIVNAPAEFQSQAPYFVVKQLEWIQTRYLFVQISSTSETVKAGVEKIPQNAHPQDPTRTPRGISDSIVIPAAAIKSTKTARGVGVKDDKKGPFKKLKLFGKAAEEPVVIADDGDDDDTSSVATETEDLTVLFDEEPEPAPVKPTSKKPEKKPQGPKTDFVPGTLDFENLPIMPMPTYASSGTTKRLMKELQSLQKVQESTPAAELGWFIDVQKIENVYQWIVELHSFHTFEVNGKPLPLATDMKKQNVRSIVLEVRYNKDFPFSPPYVRVIRPRFLSLAQGGGGHIVMGGAMCMELLTNTGWSSVSTMESVMMQIRIAIASEPYARLDPHSRGDYGTAEGAEGYLRACASHNWEVPKGFKEMAYGGGAQNGGR